MKKPCEYCGADLPVGVDKGTRRVRSFHFERCTARPVAPMVRIEMNERIKELTEQAKFMAEEDINMNITSDEKLNAFAENFAKLIIIECDKVIKDSTPTMGHGRMKANISHVGTLIKQHFGVE